VLAAGTSKKARPDNEPESSSSQELNLFKTKTKSKTNGKENSPKTDQKLPETSEKFLSSRFDREELNKSKLVQPKISDAIRSSKDQVEKAKTSGSPQTRKRKEVTDPDTAFCNIAEKRKSDSKFLQPPKHKKTSPSLQKSKTDGLFLFNDSVFDKQKHKLQASKTTKLPVAPNLDETPNLSQILKIKKEKLTQPKAVEVVFNDNSIQDIFETSSNDSVLCVGTQNSEPIKIEDSSEMNLAELEAEFQNNTEYLDDLSKRLKDEPLDVPPKKAKRVYKECRDCKKVRLIYFLKAEKLKKNIFAVLSNESGTYKSCLTSSMSRLLCWVQAPSQRTETKVSTTITYQAENQ
jgi:hypothetical protein